MLNARQEAFCLHFARTDNATESYLAAGYRPKDGRNLWASASHLCNKPAIQARIKELREAAMKEAEREAIMDINEMQKRLTAIARREETEDTVTQLGKVVQTRVSAQSAIRAIAQLARMQGVAENVNVTITVPVIADADKLQ